MKRPKPLDLSLSEEMSREEMLNMVAGATSGISGTSSTSGSSGTKYPSQEDTCSTKHEESACQWKDTTGRIRYALCRFNKFDLLA